MSPKAEGGLVKVLLNLPRLEGHLITDQPQATLLLCNIIVTDTIGTLLGDLTIAKME